MVEKKCVSCRVVKPLEDFNKNKSSSDGYKVYCRECASEQNRRYREKHREKINRKKRKDYWESKKYSEARTAKELKEGSRLCNVCQKEKPILEFYKRGNGGFYSICKECHIETTTQYANENIEQTRANRIVRENRRLARKKELISDYTNKEWMSAIDYFENKCAYCGNDNVKLTQDHFIALSKGGHYTKSNIIPACFSCNTQKHNFDFYKWYKTRDYYSLDRLIKIESYLDAVKNDNLEPSALETM